MSSDKDKLSQLTNGLLTEPMDVGTKEYEDFKLLIRSKVSETPKDKRIKIALFGLKYQIDDYLQSTIKPTPVGSFIKRFIKLIKVKQVDFAKYLEIRPSNLSKILNGERRLSIELALILEKLSSIDAELWLRVQNQNEISKIEKSNPQGLRRYRLAELIR